MRALQRRLDELKSRKDDLVEVFVFKKAIDQQTYQEQIEKLNEAISSAELDLNGAEMEDFDVEEVLSYSQFVVQNAPRLWEQAGLEQKQRLQKVLFPRGVHFLNNEFGTAETCLLFNMIRQTDAEKTSLATPPGFEPGLSDRKSEVLGLWTMGSRLQFLVESF